MKIVEVNLQEKNDYNHFVMTNEMGSFLQSWEWGEWQEAWGREEHRFWINNNYNDNNNIVGSIQLIKMPLPLGKYYLYAPYGPVIGSKRLEVRDWNDIVTELRSKFSSAVFIRIEPKKDSLSTNHYPLITKSSNIQPGKTLILDLKKSEEQLLSEMHHKTRYNIKLAQKHGVEIKDEFEISAGHGLFFEEALKLILETSTRQKFATFSAVYYEKMIDFFVHLHSGSTAQAVEYNSGQSAIALAKADATADYAVSNLKNDKITLHIYKAIFQNQLLATAIMVDFGKTRTFLFGGSSEFHKNVMAPYLLHWQAMLDAQAAGLTDYDFWGVETAGGDTPGFVRFKMGFGGQVISYAGAYDIIQNKPLYFVYNFLRKANRLVR